MSHKAIHPGERLASELESRCMSAGELARQTELPTARIVDVLAGRSPITDDMAFRLAHIFGTSAQSWLSLQTLYDRNQQKPKSGRV
jgi:addiction module HigA family antidote